MDTLIDFTNCILKSIELGFANDKVHPAWRDETNEGFLICYKVLLSFDDKRSFMVEPCEVDLPGRYPALGLSISESETREMQTSLIGLNLPSRVIGVEQTDCLDDEVINQYKLILQGDQGITIRHVLPPMSMGVKVESRGA